MLFFFSFFFGGGRLCMSYFLFYALSVSFMKAYIALHILAVSTSAPAKGIIFSAIDKIQLT